MRNHVISLQSPASLLTLARWLTLSVLWFCRLHPWLRIVVTMKWVNKEKLLGKVSGEQKTLIKLYSFYYLLHHSYYSFFYFLATQVAYGTCSTRGETCIACSGSAESWPLDHQGSLHYQSSYIWIISPQHRIQRLARSTFCLSSQFQLWSHALRSSSSFLIN